MARKSNSGSGRRSATSSTVATPVLQPSYVRRPVTPYEQLHLDRQWLEQETAHVKPRRHSIPKELSNRWPGDPRPRTTKGTPATLYAPSFNTIGFNQPNQVIRCLRRKLRRRVLFAFKRTGKGARSRRHFNFWSRITC